LVLSLVAAAGLVGALAAVAATGLSPQPRTTFDFLEMRSSDIGPEVAHVPGVRGSAVRGTCGEAGRAGDAACAGVREAEDAASVTRSPTPTSVTAPGVAGEDVRGPCDEGEHAGDPRCAGIRRPEDGSTATASSSSAALGRRDARGDQVGKAGHGSGHGEDDPAGDDRRGPKEKPGHDDAPDGAGATGRPGGSGSGRGRHGGDD
jgi:hypothetical protein